MGIRFKCQHCGRKLNVKDHLAGKRGICPSCGGRFDIPLAVGSVPEAETGADSAAGNSTPLSAATLEAEMVVTEAAPPDTTSSLVSPAVIAPIATTIADPIAESPTAHWYIAPVGSTTSFGPADGSLFRTWIAEGRVGPDSMVWREGWTDWRVASEVLPQMQALLLPPHAVEAVPTKSPAWSTAANELAPTTSSWSQANSPPTTSAASKVLPTTLVEKRKVPKSIYLMLGLVLLLIPLLIYVVVRSR